MPDLSVLIPSRNEPYLRHTVEDILKNSRADTEVIVILDGGWPVEPLQQHEKVTLVYHPQSVGQRAATNEAARISEAKYIAKCDAHVAFDEGFDAKLIKAAEELGPDVTQVPAQHNLHVHNFRCRGCGNETYQCPPLTNTSKCVKCGATPGFDKVMVWKPRRGVRTVSWVFDTQPKFQYGGNLGKRPGLIQGDFIETMCCLGAFWFMSRDRFWQLGGCDERHGSWGSMGIEVGCKSWLSGGRMVTNTRTWFAHFFRVGGIGFPYPIHGSDQEKARRYSRSLWFENAWPGQVHPLSWLIEKFKPLPDWHDTSGAARLADVMAADAAFASRQEQALSRGRQLGEVASIDADRALTAAPSSPGMIPQGREEMAPDAVGSPSLLSGGAATAKDIGALENEAEVSGIAAQLDVAAVIGDEYVPSEAALQGAVEPSHKNAVDVNLRTVGSSCGEPDSRVADIGDVPSPDPASVGLDLDLGEDPGQHLAIEVRDGEDAVSHSGPPVQVPGRSGPGGATTSSGPLIVQEGTHETKAHEDGHDQHQRESGSGRDSDAALRDEESGARSSAAGVSLASPHAAGRDTSKASAETRVKEVMPTGHPHGVAVVKPAPSGTGAGSPSKGIVFYTENRLDPVIAAACRAQLRRAVNGIPIVSVSINGPCNLGRNVQLQLERGYLTMFEQILRGLEEQDADVVFLCEHDLLYSPSHFDFTPPRQDVYYYNLATWKVDAESGRALHYITRQTSGLCAYRSLLLDHYRKRVERVKREGFSRKMGFEPGTHGRPERVDDFKSGDWWSEVPNVDIRHEHNLTNSRWKREDFRSQRNCRGWTESDSVPGWGVTKGRFDEFLRERGKA